MLLALQGILLRKIDIVLIDLVLDLVEAGASVAENVCHLYSEYIHCGSRLLE